MVSGSSQPLAREFVDRDPGQFRWAFSPSSNGKNVDASVERLAITVDIYDGASVAVTFECVEPSPVLRKIWRAEN
jgi:hypothetical protein